MRWYCNILALSGAAMLAACGGDTAPQTVGGNAPPTGGPGAGPGGGVGGGSGGGSTPTPTPANFLDVTTATSFDVIGGFEALDSQRQPGGAVATLYTGNASTVATPSGTINYNPRDGIFTLTVADTAASVSREYRFQDPAHRASFTGSEFAARQLPNLTGFNYLELFDGTTTPVFFYQRPGTQTTYVSLGGYARTVEDQTAGTYNGERGVFVFGQKTASMQIPGSGSGTYTGGFLASMVADPTGGAASYQQWINGSSSVAVNFGTGAVSLSVNGTVGDAFSQGAALDPSLIAVAAGSTFRAAGTANLDLLRSNFSGSFTQNAGTAQNVGFTNGTNFLGIDFASVAQGGATAGASSIDGTFFGPNAVNLGGNFRIIGGVPNQRIDILGAFTGAKQ